ncbi:Bacterial mobilization protein (MobC)/AT hook motif protein [Belliella baltica DSM 15883]|uniref:Bacterial mobilization protein (MobC)/AT hook motif protein n=1 Tax=Belliella baltica (strain DSM 15883 / CIP 108006 / LMG 21964 / BA134) TaxID=866536 RepID=I3Z991_BELBD|nr:plasmid mobilization relaxosome protein MobC [Belliella baltica]AFL85809.1 Bacterial mobilization protein (MobC)/AT hook motif protein [Belliella baltica DSM 15883]
MKKLANEKKTDGKTRKRGRPKKAITRSVSLVVRLTPTERLAIAGKARNAGMRISDWFRQSAKVAVIRPRLSEKETGHLRTLSGMANNLNQLTKLAHKGGLVSIMTNLRGLLNEVERLMERMGRDDS